MLTDEGRFGTTRNATSCQAAEGQPSSHRLSCNRR